MEFQPMIFTPSEMEAANHLLFVETSGVGYPPGDFHYKLIKAMQHADHINLQKLLTAFPEYRRPVQVMRLHGSDHVIEIMKYTKSYLAETGKSDVES